MQKVFIMIVSLYFRNGANIGYTDQEGRSAFHWAMKIPNIRCLKWLCKYANNMPHIANQPVSC